MAWSFPLSLAAFFQDFDITAHGFELPPATEQLTLGGGEVLTAQLGTRLWRGTVEIAADLHVPYEDVMARLHLLERPGASFLLAPPHLENTGLTNGTLSAVQNGREVRFAGLGANAVRRRGTFFSFAYGSNPARQAFHQLTESVTVDATGLTPFAEVEPPIRPGFALGAAVTFATPWLKAVLVAGSVRPARIRRAVAQGASFDWVQTLR